MEKGITRILGVMCAAALAVCLAAGSVRAKGPVFEVAAYLLPPMSGLDKGGNLRGETVDVIGRVLSAMGYTPKFKVLPFRRCLAAMRDGAVPLMLPCAVNIERQAFMRFSDPVDFMHTTLWKKGAGESGCWETLGDLAGRRIGVIEGVLLRSQVAGGPGHRDLPGGGEYWSGAEPVQFPHARRGPRGYGRLRSRARLVP